MLTILLFILILCAIAVGYNLHTMVTRAHFDEMVKNQRICKNCFSRLKQELLNLKLISENKKEKLQK